MSSMSSIAITRLGRLNSRARRNSHTAILARSMNIPALIQCKEIQDDWDGKMAVVDGYNACVYVDPTPDLLESLTKRQQEDQKKLALLSELKGKPNTTLDGKTINVFANIGGISDVGAVQQNDAGGVGLFRTEFVYRMNTETFREYQIGTEIRFIHLRKETLRHNCHNDQRKHQSNNNSSQCYKTALNQ